MKKPIANKFIPQEEYLSDTSYIGYDMLSKSMNNWSQLCAYQLNNIPIKGRHQVLQLKTMQIIFAHREGSTMHNAYPARNTINIAITTDIQGVACFGEMKISKGDMYIFDDLQGHNFIINKSIDFIAISIDKKHLNKELDYFKSAYHKLFKDNNDKVKDFLYSLLEKFISQKELFNYSLFDEIEKKILLLLKNIITNAPSSYTKLTKGEKIAIIIRDKLFAHMDSTQTIHSLAKEYQIREQTLQNSFKSLFGFTPKYFIRTLKLNIIHYELQQKKLSTITISRIANKWGFNHMGRFSQYYKELFLETPSKTREIAQRESKFLSFSCVQRKEEI